MFAMISLDLLVPNQIDAGMRSGRKRRYADVFDDDDLHLLPWPKRRRIASGLIDLSVCVVNAGDQAPSLM